MAVGWDGGGKGGGGERASDCGLSSEIPYTLGPRRSHAKTDIYSPPSKSDDAEEKTCQEAKRSYEMEIADSHCRVQDKYVEAASVPISNGDISDSKTRCGMWSINRGGARAMARADLGTREMADRALLAEKSRHLRLLRLARGISFSSVVTQYRS